MARYEKDPWIDLTDFLDLRDVREFEQISGHNCALLEDGMQIVSYEELTAEMDEF